MKIRTAIAVLAVSCAALLACTKPTREAAKEWDGLELREQKNLDAVYVKPNVTFKHYQQVLLTQPQVAFSKNWDPNQSTAASLGSRLNARDIEEIKTGIATEFRKSFEASLGAGGYKLATEPGEDVLRVDSALVDIYINAPDTMSASRSRVYTTDSGRMTLVMELRDSTTGELLARVVDKEEGREFGMMQVTNRVTNTADLRVALNKWAGALRAGLDKVNGKTPAG